MVLRAVHGGTRGKGAPRHELSKFGGVRFHAFPDSMLATLCANKYPKSKNNSIKDPACAQPARQEAPKTLLGRSHPEEAGIYVFMDSLIAC